MRKSSNLLLVFRVSAFEFAPLEQMLHNVNENSSWSFFLSFLSFFFSFFACVQGRDKESGPSHTKGRARVARTRFSYKSPTVEHLLIG